jgi:hypothetical protein
VTPHPTDAPSPTRCPAHTPGLIPGRRRGVEWTVLVDLTCGLPAGHHSPEHYDLEHRMPWLHPHDPAPEPHPALSTPETP